MAFFFSEDAAIFPQQRPIVEGLDAIKKYYKETGFNPEGLKWEPIRAEISKFKDLGFTYGYWELKIKDKEGQEKTIKGKYVTIWKKQKDGKFKIVVDIGNI